MEGVGASKIVGRYLWTFPYILLVGSIKQVSSITLLLKAWLPWAGGLLIYYVKTCRGSGGSENVDVFLFSVLRRACGHVDDGTRPHKVFASTITLS